MGLLVKILNIVVIFSLVIGLWSCNRANFGQGKKPAPEYPTLVKPELEYEYKADFFDQTASRRGRKIDIIWGIDASGSMAEEINAINKNIVTFLKSLDTYEIDYRVALLIKNFRKFNLTFPVEVKDCDNRDVSKEKICKFSTHINSYNALKVILNCFRLTHKAAYLPMFSNYRYKDDRLITSLPWSCGDPEEKSYGKLADKFGAFSRSGVHKEIIIVSDDESFVTAEGFINTLKPVISSFTVHSIVGTNATFARYTGNDFTPNSQYKPSGVCQIERISSVYPEVSKKTEGLVMDICEKDWRKIFDQLKIEVIKKTTFTLSSTPIVASIKVHVNDKLISNAAWVYDVKTNNIIFNAAHIPPLDSEVKVRYSIPKTK